MTAVKFCQNYKHLKNKTNHLHCVSTTNGWVLLIESILENTLYISNANVKTNFNGKINNESEEFLNQPVFQQNCEKIEVFDNVSIVKCLEEINQQKCDTLVLQGLLFGLKLESEDLFERTIVYTDSDYLYNLIEQWIDKWNETDFSVIAGGKTIQRPNFQILQELIKFKQQKNLIVRLCSSDFFNDMYRNTI